jgi:hypothetical protein
MKTASHIFNTIHGEVTVEITIFRMDAVEAIDVYEQDPYFFGTGGYRIEGSINGVPRGMHFYGHSNLAAKYFGEGAEDAARAFLAEAHQQGFFAA